jgi:formate dehydrogenase iron-sulfur subunit
VSQASPQKTDISRRQFLSSFGAAGVGLLLPGAAQAAGKKDEELVTLHDLTKCVGCGACVDACREANAHKFPEPVRPFPPMFPATVKAEDWSTRRHVTDRLTPYNWLCIQTARGQYQGQRFEVHIPRRCMHCQNPPCANLCPWGAAAREDNGIVRIDSQICLGGAKCKTVCPWEIPMRQTGVGLYLKLLPRYGGNGVMYKCDRCTDRVAKGQKPACIEACPYEVQEIGPRSEMVAKAHALARSIGGYVYGEKENAGTNSLYVSPVPFDTLDAAVTTGAGKPHLSPVPDMMAHEDRMAAAALFAPIAGIVGGVLRVTSRLVVGGKPVDELPKAALKADTRSGLLAGGFPRGGTGAPADASAGAKPQQAGMNAPPVNAVPEKPAVRRSPFARGVAWAYVALVALLAVTGIMQMPIASRYRIVAVPGLGWLGDFWLTHKLHYLGAIGLLLLTGYVVTVWTLKWRREHGLSALGWTRAGVLALLIATGAVRVLKNLPGVNFSPDPVMLVDWAHLGLALLLGGLALARLAFKGSYWAAPGKRAASQRTGGPVS